MFLVVLQIVLDPLPLQVRGQRLSSVRPAGVAAAGRCGRIFIAVFRFFFDGFDRHSGGRGFGGEQLQLVARKLFAAFGVPGREQLFQQALHLSQPRLLGVQLRGDVDQHLLQNSAVFREGLGIDRH